MGLGGPRNNDMLPPLRLRTLLRVQCATPRGYGTYGSNRSPNRTIQTLNPDLLAPSDFVDLSDRVPRLYLSGAAGPVLYYYRTVGRKFPSNARGFLYLHRPASLPPVAAEIRLRLTPEPNPSLFSTGADLLCDFTPWSINLARIVKNKNYAPFKAQVTSDGLIDRALMDSLELALQGYAYQGFNTQTICTLTQPFEMNLKSISTPISILTARTHGRLHLERLFCDHRTPAGYNPYTGRILVHFDISPLPEHARPASRPPVLVLRVLKILTHIKAVPGYDMHLPMPEEGGMLSKWRTGPITFDLEKIKPSSKILRDLRLLVE